MTRCGKPSVRDSVTSRLAREAPTLVAGRGIRQTYVLAGFTRCTHCGGSMQAVSCGSSDRRALRYICLTHCNRGGSVCTNGSIDARIAKPKPEIAPVRSSNRWGWWRGTGGRIDCVRRRVVAISDAIRRQSVTSNDQGLRMRRRPTCVVSVSGAVLMIICAACSAWAAEPGTICNSGKVAFEFAGVQRYDAGLLLSSIVWISQGWVAVQPGECADMVEVMTGRPAGTAPIHLVFAFTDKSGVWGTAALDFSRTQDAEVSKRMVCVRGKGTRFEYQIPDGEDPIASCPGVAIPAAVLWRWFGSIRGLEIEITEDDKATPFDRRLNP